MGDRDDESDVEHCVGADGHCREVTGSVGQYSRNRTLGNLVQLEVTDQKIARRYKKKQKVKISSSSGDGFYWEDARGWITTLICWRQQGQVSEAWPVWSVKRVTTGGEEKLEDVPEVRD